MSKSRVVENKKLQEVKWCICHKTLQTASKQTSLHILAQSGDMSPLRSLLDRIADDPRKEAFLRRFVVRLDIGEYHSIASSRARGRYCWLYQYQPAWEIPALTRNVVGFRSCGLVFHVVFGIQRQQFENTQPFSCSCNWAGVSLYWNSKKYLFVYKYGRICCCCSRG